MTPFASRALCAGTALLLVAGLQAPAHAAPSKARRAPVDRTADDAAPAEKGVVLMSMGSSRVVNLPAAMSDVIIANPAVADVHVRSQRQLYLIAKGPGQTDVTITTAGGRTIYKAAVRVGNNLTNVDQMLKLAMPESDITVTSLNGMILLTGTVAAPEDAAEAERLVNAFAGGSGNVLSRLRTATPLTVNLQVRIAEVSRNLTKQIGFNWATSDTTGGFHFGIAQGSAGSITNGTFSASGATTTLGFNYMAAGLNILQTLDLAENQGLATTLANPNLTALSGETASFLAGGEIPIPLSSGIGQVSVDYKQYGVSLSFTPTVLAGGRISMRVRPEVSQLDDSAGVRLNGFSIPGISSRRAETTVELGSGQSFMIGGLLTQNSSNSIQKAPFLGDIPILGNLFKSTGFRRQETELVIIVTPYLVRPVDARDIHLPNDGLRNATDGQRYLGAKLHDGQTGGERPVPVAAPPVTVTPDALPTAPARASRKAGSAAPGFSF